MFAHKWTPNAPAEKRQLLVLFLGASVVAACLWFFAGARVMPIVLAVVATVSLTGFLFHRWIGRDVYLTFTILSAAIGGVISKIVMLLFYVIAIGIFGSILRLFGMNRLRRRFEVCNQYETMFVDAPATSIESFRRQS